MREMSPPRLLVVGVVLPAAAYLAVAAYIASSPTSEEAGETYDERLAVLVTASFCVASQREELVEAWPVIRHRLDAEAGSAGHRVRTLGVSIDVNPLRGVEALSRYGDFDEISSGSNWANLGVRTYIWERFPGRAAIPQILFLRRTTRQGPGGYEVLEEELLTRLVGIAEIVGWAEAHAP